MAELQNLAVSITYDNGNRQGQCIHFEMIFGSDAIEVCLFEKPTGKGTLIIMGAVDFVYKWDNCDYHAKRTIRQSFKLMLEAKPFAA